MSPAGAAPSGSDPHAGFEPVSLDTDGGRLAGLRLRTDVSAGPHRPRLLCLHGWLDAATSFVPLARELDPDVELVALDLPGHGASAHAASGYGLLDMALAARRAIAALGWERCTVVGHSLGANVALWLAVADPEAVESLVLLDSAGPPAEAPQALPARLRRALADRLDPSRFAPRTFPDLDAAIDHRLRHARLSRASARLVMARQCEATADGVRWRFDPALRRANETYRTEAQVLAALGAVAAPALVAFAESGFPIARAETPGRLAALAGARRVTLPGHHHVHMDDPVPVARAVREFLEVAPPSR